MDMAVSEAAIVSATQKDLRDRLRKCLRYDAPGNGRTKFRAALHLASGVWWAFKREGTIWKRSGLCPQPNEEILCDGLAFRKLRKAGLVPGHPTYAFYRVA